MSLKKDFSIQGNVTVKDAIIKIEELVINNGGSITIKVCVYNSLDEKDTKEVAFQSQYRVEGDKFNDIFGESVVKTENKSSLSQAYVYLKTLPKFNGAIDI